MKPVVGALLLGALMLFGVARVLYPVFRLRWLRRQLAVSDALVRAAGELSMHEASSSVDRIAEALETGAMSEAQALELGRAQAADIDRRQHEMHPVYLRNAQLRTEFWRRVPRRELDDEVRRLEARIADMAPTDAARAGLRYEVSYLESMRSIREPELSRGGTIVAIVFFVFAIGLFAVRRFG